MNRDGGLRLLFGPQCSEIGESIGYIRSAILNDPALEFLRKVLDELPSLWPVITSAWPGLEGESGETQLIALNQLVQSGLPAASVEATNLILTPVTVMRHIVEFWNLQKVAKHPAFPSSRPRARRVIDTQGFCVGILAAITVACSRSTGEFQAISSNAIRLAVCIGALVDLDGTIAHDFASIALRWETQIDYERLEQILANDPNVYISCLTDINSATITLPKETARQVTQELSGGGLRAKQIPLRGRFHHQLHCEGVQCIIELCARDNRFQLPSGDALLLPLRSNLDGEVIEDAMLHAVALDSILTAKANWWKTVSAVLNNMQKEADTSSLVSVGPGKFVPRLARSRLVQRNNLPEAHNLGLTNGEKPISLAVPLLKGGHMPQHSPQVPPIAIIGMACRYPGADSVSDLWELLELGQCAVETPPENRFRLSHLQREPKAPFWGHFLARPDAFDHRFFGVSAREAESMDPQQRLLLQVAYEAMESAGLCGWYATELFQDVGCYVGVGSEDYTENIASRHASAFSATGSLQSFIAGRISHYFGWSGPSITLDTACSSAAVAIHLACKALQTKECPIAVAGGVNVLTNPRVYQNLAAASFLSPTGACKPFDAAADGYCRGEGAGLVVLRPLQDAIDNGNPILAVISGSAVNQGSNNSPITVPDSESQQSLYLKALSISGIAPEEITYVEAHGTGTQVGDPIELDSLRKTFGNPGRPDKLYVGSIKGNIGHTETASGVAGLLKTVLMLQNQRIPRQANFSRLNPKVVPPIDQDRLVIPVDSTGWESPGRVAMVTNYGASGSNAAIVVSEYVADRSEQKERFNAKLLEMPILISAKSKESIRSYCSVLHSLLSNPQPDTVRDLAYNLAIKQNRDMPFNVTFPTASDPELLCSRLESISSGMAGDIQKRANNQPPVILCFGGQNGSMASISRELFDSCALFQAHLMACEQVGHTLGLPSLFPTIFESEPIGDIIHLHFMLFSIQYACAKSWLDSGLRPARIIGHSFGQLTALSVVGSLGLDDGLRLVTDRARLIQTRWGPESGVMLSVEGTENDVHILLDQTNHAADIACFNGPRHLVLAGSDTSIRAIEGVVAGNTSINLQVRRLANTHAFHSRLVDGILPGLTKLAETLTYEVPTIPIEACSLTGDWSTLTPDKIVEHSRMPVYFKNAVERVAQRVQNPAVWLEAGSASPIIPMVRRVLEISSSLSVPHVYQRVDLGGLRGVGNLAQATSNLWSQGVHVQFWPFHLSQRSEFKWMNLPPYQFTKSSHWIDYDPAAFSSPSTSSQPATDQTGLLRQLSHGPDEYLFTVNTKESLYRSCTQGHAVLGQSLCPVSMYIELVLRAITYFPTDENSAVMPHIESLAISSPLVLDPQGFVSLRLSHQDRQTWSFSLSSSETQNEPLIHAKGNVSLCQLGQLSSPIARFRSLGRLIDASRGKVIEDDATSSGLKGSTVYSALERVTNYANYYRGVRQIFANGHEATGLVSMAPSATYTTCDPILIDNFLQVAGIHVNCLSGRQEDQVFVCNGIGETLIGELYVNRVGTSPSIWKVYTNHARPSKNEVVCDIYVMDSRTDNLAVTFTAVTFTSVSIRSLTRTLVKLNNDGAILEPQGNKTQVVPMLQHEHLATEDTTANEGVTGTAAVDGHLAAVQEMLCELFGVGLDEISPSSSLNDIGVDSLMTTEVLSEIKKRFQVNMRHPTLAECTDVQSLTQRIFPGGLSPPSINAFSPRPVVEPLIQPIHPETHDSPVPITELSLASVAYNYFVETRATVSHTQDAHWADFFSSVYPKQLTLITAYIVEAFRSLGLSLDSFQPGEDLPGILVLPRHEQLRKHLYAILESVNIIRRTPTGQITRTGNAIPQVSSQTLHAQIRSQHPPYALEHDLLRITGSRLADCLTGEADGVSLIFKDAETRRLLENVYIDAPVFKSGNLYLARYLTDIVRSLGSNRDIRILEIGAGTGGTTKHLLDKLTEMPEKRLQYTFSDISPSLVVAARKKFAMHSFVHYETLDVEKSPPATFHGKYDIVISSNCVHATRDITQCCINMRKLLRPDGILCLVELTRDIFWLDLVFGLLDGWWLFNDGREHALASEHLWNQALRKAGYEWVSWTDNSMVESNALRVIVASPYKAFSSAQLPSSIPIRQETVMFAERDGVKLFADIYYPGALDSKRKPRPIALMIHGGGHVMLSRKDVRTSQIQTLLDVGFLPISIDYRLCPEISLIEGPMRDVQDALGWVRRILPSLPLLRRDVRPDGNQVVAVGWSTGGHLAMTLGWTAPANGINPPEAILAFYCPTDYEDPFWSQPNFPFQEVVSPNDIQYDPWEGVRDAPITGYNPPLEESPRAGWMSTSDPRSRIALHMNWKGQTLPVLLKGWMYKDNYQGKCFDLSPPTAAEIQAVSPLYQIRNGRYRTPTFFIHGTLDDLVPCEETERTYKELVSNGIEAEIRVVHEALHLFDIYASFHASQRAVDAVADGYMFLHRHVSI
ncbi:hypothetical protein BBP40_008644 [Aspergillus hancockii]|nr:hypothetical protein BBP40_008644 [Aspergillus hancockii]